MRRLLLTTVAVTGFSIGIAMSGSPALAQRGLPVCLHSKDDLVECRFTSMAQCMVTANGIGADCLPNPAYARGPSYGGAPYDDAPPPRRRVRGGNPDQY